MSRPLLAVVVAAAALALLASFTWQSRSVPLDAHVARHTIAAALERNRDDLGALIAALESAWQRLRAPGDGARTIAARLAASGAALAAPAADIPGNASQRSRIRNSFETYEGTLGHAAWLAGELLDEQTAYADSVSFLRDQGPAIVQSLRDAGRARAAADTFQLLAGTLEFAAPDASRGDMDLRRGLAILGRDTRIDTRMPSGMPQLRDAVDTILTGKAQIASKLEQLAATSAPRHGTSFGEAVDASYRASVRSVDQARLMLSVYAVLLFAAVGYVVLRLQGSYRELNRANASLAQLNESLEQRVADRTRELRQTLNDLKESQVQLVQAEKMSSLGQLVAGISHEINTPLLYLSNNAALIQERLELFDRFLKHNREAFSIRPEAFKSRAEYQTRFVDALRHLKSMIREDELEAAAEEALDLSRDSMDGLRDLTEMAQSLKDFSRLDRAPVASFDVNAGLDKTLLIAKNIVKHKAEVRKFYGDVPEIRCSPSQINQVFLNLITNAAQAIDDHGEIVITTRQHDDQHVAITVSDTGCGISAENLARIRDPFFTTKAVGSGTGLGLSIVDEIVRSHSGELRVESEVGRGSSFTVVLPLEQRDDAVRPAADAADGDADPQLAEAV